MSDKLTPAERDRAARIARYQAAYLAAHGFPVGCHYTGRQYRVANRSNFTSGELDRAAERLEAQAAKAAVGFGKGKTK